MGITQAKGWLKGVAVGAAFAALVALPMFGMSAGKVSYSDLAHGSGGGAGKVVFQDFHFAKVQMQDFHFTMRVNKASPKLMLACATGEHIKEAILTCRKAGKEQQEYLKIKFSDLLVSSYQTGGSAGDVIPMDQISLNFSKIELEYKEQKPDGTLGGATKAGYDLKLNKQL